MHNKFKKIISNYHNSLYRCIHTSKAKYKDHTTDIINYYVYNTIWFIIIAPCVFIFHTLNVITTTKQSRVLFI